MTASVIVLGGSEQPALLRCNRRAQPGVSRRQRAISSSVIRSSVRIIGRPYGAGASLRQRPAHHAAAFGAEVAVGHFEDPVGAGGEDLIEMAVEVLEIEDRH